MTSLLTDDPPLGLVDESDAPSPKALGTRALSTRFPARTLEAHWLGAGRSRSEVLAMVSAPTGLSGFRVQSHHRRGLPLLLDWLEEQPGDSWQERWLHSGADGAGDDWASGPRRWLEHLDKYSVDRLNLMTSSLLVMIGADVIRPSLGWLLTGGKKRKLTRNIIRARDREGFEQLDQICERDPGIPAHAQRHAFFRCAVIIAAKGGTIADITIGDVVEILDAERGLRHRSNSGAATFKALREMGVFGSDVPTLREIRGAQRHSVEELVDRYSITSRPIRDLLVDYLKERQPAIDYGTLVTGSYVLAKCFWVDLEEHHPGITTLHLSSEVASAWKRRLQTKTTTTRTPTGETIDVAVERFSYLDVLSSVRAFYLDLSQWALDDPGRWARWVAPCPIRPQDLTRRKAVRRRKARMDARTRDRLPVLPILVRAVDQWRKDTETTLAAARRVQPGEQFSAMGETLVRSVRPHAAVNNIWVEDLRGTRRLLNREEDNAFWAWASIGVLRLTGVRVEELLELSHYSLVQYRLPTTGELIPLIQIAPSKTDTERLLVVSPELSDVLSAIICRIRDDNETVPLVRARDSHERIWQSESPLLFQRRSGAENHAIGAAMISSLLDEALSHTGLLDRVHGTALHYTPHDFRRMFLTDAIMNGLPPHIAQVIAGHRDINVTMGYNAVYPEETIRAHLAFLSRRRSLRPSEEYRVPTDEEWQEFLGHFERRKVSIGTCARAFDTPCIHEHACVRCPMLWPEPKLRPRLVEITENLADRIAEAEREGWLGEVDGLQISLAGAHNKLAQIDQRSKRSVALDFGDAPG
ncbi:MAG TPA: site-specific integrase [Acidimicrobiales bacterium]|nr:site-specific integrase [Acidimicrobiales bacterium]